MRMDPYQLRDKWLADPNDTEKRLLWWAAKNRIPLIDNNKPWIKLDGWRHQVAKIEPIFWLMTTTDDEAIAGEQLLHRSSILTNFDLYQTIIGDEFYPIGNICRITIDDGLSFYILSNVDYIQTINNALQEYNYIPHAVFRYTRNVGIRKLFPDEISQDVIEQLEDLGIKYDLNRREDIEKIWTAWGGQIGTHPSDHPEGLYLYAKTESNKTGNIILGEYYSGTAEVVPYSSWKALFDTHDDQIKEYREQHFGSAAKSNLYYYLSSHRRDIKPICGAYHEFNEALIKALENDAFYPGFMLGYEEGLNEPGRYDKIQPRHPDDIENECLYIIPDWL